LGLCSAGPGKIFMADCNRLFELSRRTTGAYHARLVAGDGPIFGMANGIGSEARFSGLGGLCLGRDGNLFATDCDNDLVRTISIPLLLQKQIDERKMNV